jgi:hypothetical protein
MSPLGLGCVKTRRRGEPIEWTFRQIAISAVRILRRSQVRSIRERSFFSFSSFRGFHTAWVMGGGPAKGRRGSAAFPIPDHLLHRGTPRLRANSGLMHCSKTASLFDHFVGELLETQRYIKAECLGGLEVDHELKLAGLHNGQLLRLLPLENPPGIKAHLTISVG